MAIIINSVAQDLKTGAGWLERPQNFAYALKPCNRIQDKPGLPQE